MAGSLQGWQVIIHSPGVSHPSLVTMQPARKSRGVKKTLKCTSSPPISFFPFLALQEARLSLAAQLPRVTSHYQNEVWGVRPVPLSGAGPNKVPYVAARGGKINCCFLKQGTALTQSLDTNSCTRDRRHSRQITVVKVAQQQPKMYHPTPSSSTELGKGRKWGREQKFCNFKCAVGYTFICSTNI